MFHDILERKTSFKDFKSIKLKKSKNWDLSNGDSPWFRAKLARFPFFFLGKIGQHSVLHDILE